MTRVLLTGANGMVGRNLLEQANRSRWDIVASTRQTLDLLDGPAVARFFAAARPAIVIHAAGRVGGIQANMAHPAVFLADNVRMGLNVLDAAHAVPACRTINLSSSCVYPADALNPLTEDMILSGSPEPTNEGYALAKIAVMRYGRYLNRASGDVRIKSLIPCNLYGRHDSFAPEKSHLVPAVIAKVDAARAVASPAVTIWGDGTARREFALASDVAGWIWEAADRFDALPETMNLGVDGDHMIRHYYETAAKVIGWTGRFDYDLDQPTGMRRKKVDISHQRRLGFAAPTSLEAGLQSTYDYFREARRL